MKFSSLAQGAVLVAAALLAGHAAAQAVASPEPAASAPPTSAAQQATRLTLEQTRIRTSADLRLEPSMAPLWVEFEGSAALTARLREAVERQGLALAPSKELAKSTLVVAGEVELRGGPIYHRGARAKLRDGGKVEASDAGLNGAAAWKLGVDTLAAVAIPSAWSVTDLVTGLLHAAGVGSWFNRALVGDPRGVCLGQGCKTWNHVRQTVVLKGHLRSGDTPAVIVGSAAAAFSETVDPDHLVAMATLALLQAMGDAEASAFFERHGRTAQALAEASR